MFICDDKNPGKVTQLKGFMINTLFYRTFSEFSGIAYLS